MLHIPTHYLDVVGSCASFISTLYFINVNKYAWPFGLLAILINITLYYKIGLYADVLKEGIYLSFMIYGWYLWTHPTTKNNAPLPISRLQSNEIKWLACIFSICTVLLIYILSHHTNSQTPYWDAITTTLSLTAQYLICKKRIECWILWFIADALYVGLYWHKHVPAHSILLIIYCGMAIMGHIRWARLYKKQNHYN